MNKITESYHEVIAGLYGNYGHATKIWLRAHHPTGIICAFKTADEVKCFAIFTDGTYQFGQHHELVSLFRDK